MANSRFNDILKVIAKIGQESVWDYPRPPKLEKTTKQIQIIFNDIVFVDSTQAFRVLETSHPPVYYIPPEDIKMEYLIKTFGLTYCEWKGTAHYYDLKIGEKIVRRAGWYYPNPTKPFQEIKNYVAFYPEPMDKCTINDEVVQPQPGDFYGGWITSDIVGPFKGEPGTERW